MFDIGFQELIVIFVVALLVFGPERLPEIGRLIGKWMNEFKRSVDSVKDQMQSELHPMDTQHGIDLSALDSEKKEDTIEKKVFEEEKNRGEG